MKTLFERYKDLKIDGSLICLKKIDDIYPYFCYPSNAKAIGFDGSIMYCFIEPYDDMVFACNPESCTTDFVYPLAKNFEVFLKLILACGSTNPIEQIVWMTQEQFNDHIKDEAKIRTNEQNALLDHIKKEFNISPIDDPYDYVKRIQADFDCSKIEYGDEYYEVLGIEKD